MRRSYKGISINTSENTHEKVFELIEGDTNRTVVDIPTGSGAFVQRAKDAGFAKILAVDIENILEIEHDDFLEGDMTRDLPMPDESCDVVVCIDGIEHISRQYDFVREVHRVLKKGGEFIVSTPNTSSLRSRWKWFLTGHHLKCNAPLDENNPSPLHHIGMVSYPELRYLLHTSGFRIQRVTTNRIKAVSYLFVLLLPLIWLTTKLVYRKASRKENTASINSEVFSAMFTKDVLFGETLIVKGVKS